MTNLSKISSNLEKFIKDNKNSKLEDYLNGNSNNFNKTYISVASLGILFFLAVAVILPFKNNIFSQIFQKTFSHAAGLTASPTDWPQVQKDARHSGYATQTVIGPYTKLWERDRAFPVSARVQPIVAGGIIFIPSNDKKLYALNATSGTTSWSFPTGGALVNSAAFDNGLVYIGSTDNSVYGIDGATGAQVWKQTTGGPVKTAPVIANGQVYIGSTDGFFYAFNELTGVVTWKTNIGSPILDTAAFDSGKVFFGGMDSKGYALDGTTGNILWSVQTVGQGFRDRWTVAGNGAAFFTPRLYQGHYALQDGTTLFHNNATPIIYNQPWATQKTTILSWITSHAEEQPLYVIDETTGVAKFTPPVLYVSGGSESEHSQPVLLPNGNADVMYRRTFGEAANWGQTTNDAIYSGELVLNSTTGTVGDVLPIDTCMSPASCGSYKGQYTSDESTSHMRTGDVLYLNIARGLYGLDTKNSVALKTIACYNNSSGQKFCEPGTAVTFNDYVANSACGAAITGGGWRLDPCNAYSELNGDGNDIVRPATVANDTFYVVQANSIFAVKGVIRP